MFADQVKNCNGIFLKRWWSGHALLYVTVKDKTPSMFIKFVAQTNRIFFKNTASILACNCSYKFMYRYDFCKYIYYLYILLDLRFN